MITTGLGQSLKEFLHGTERDRKKRKKRSPGCDEVGGTAAAGRCGRLLLSGCQPLLPAGIPWGARGKDLTSLSHSKTRDGIVSPFRCYGAVEEVP